MRFAALGRTKMLHDAILACVEAGHEPVLIGTATAAREYGVNEHDYRELAERHGCPFLAHADTTEAEIVELAARAGADVAISMNWPTMIGRELRERLGHGVINAHPGDLPRYRGNACPNWAILNAEAEVVLTLHLMSDDLDAGPVLLKRPFPLGADTYVGAVYAFLAGAVPQAFVEALDGLERGQLHATPQPDDPSLALRCYPRRPADSQLDWRLTAETLARLVRASAEPFAGAFTHLDGRRLTVWRAHPTALSTPALGVPGQVVAVDRPAGTVDVLTGDGVLVLEEAALEGGTRGAAMEMVSSLRARLGLDVERELAGLATRVAALEQREP